MGVTLGHPNFKLHAEPESKSGFRALSRVLDGIPAASYFTSGTNKVSTNANLSDMVRLFLRLFSR